MHSEESHVNNTASVQRFDNIPKQNIFNYIAIEWFSSKTCACSFYSHWGKYKLRNVASKKTEEINRGLGITSNSWKSLRSATTDIHAMQQQVISVFTRSSLLNTS